MDLYLFILYLYSKISIFCLMIAVFAFMFVESEQDFMEKYNKRSMRYEVIMSELILLMATLAVYYIITLLREISETLKLQIQPHRLV